MKLPRKTKLDQFHKNINLLTALIQHPEVACLQLKNVNAHLREMVQQCQAVDQLDEEYGGPSLSHKYILCIHNIYDQSHFSFYSYSTFNVFIFFYFFIFFKAVFKMFYFYF